MDSSTSANLRKLVDLIYLEVEKYYIKNSMSKKAKITDAEIYSTCVCLIEIDKIAKAYQHCGIINRVVGKQVLIISKLLEDSLNLLYEQDPFYLNYTKGYMDRLFVSRATIEKLIIYLGQ